MGLVYFPTLIPSQSTIHVDKYTIHGWYGIELDNDYSGHRLLFHNPLCFVLLEDVGDLYPSYNHQRSSKPCGSSEIVLQSLQGLLV